MAEEDPKLEALIRELEAAQQQLGDPVAKEKRVAAAQAALDAYRRGDTPDRIPIDE